MKNLYKLLPVILLLLIPETVSSQRFEITGYTGWMLGGKINYYNGSAKVRDGQNWGLILGYSVADDMTVEFMYNRLVSNLQVQEYPDEPYDMFEMATQYFNIGVAKELISDGIVRPFGSVSLGVTVFSPHDSGYNDQWWFSGALGGGLKIFPTEHIGIRLQARLLVPMYFSGLGFWCGTGGCSGGAGTSSVIVQGDFTGGIILAF